MSLWEYKVITSGKGGFATPALLEKFLNDLGREEWEIVEFRSQPDNLLAFTGLARRSTQRDWTLQDAAAAAAKAEAEKLRAEFAAKFQAATSNAPAAEEKPASFLEEKLAPDDGFRKPVDTSRDDDPDAPDEEAGDKDEWDKLAQEDELPSFFDALKPHMRRNQRGPGMSVGTDYLAKKWDLAESDIKGALVECGLQIPADEDAKPVYVEYDGDLYWVNINRRGEVWINTREKPRPVFRVVQATKFTPEAAEETKPENGNGEARAENARPPRSERPAPAQTQAPDAPAVATAGETSDARPDAAPAVSTGVLPQGTDLLARIKPLMRRNRRGPGGSGSASFLARALKTTEAELANAFAVLGLVMPAGPNDAPVNVEIAGAVWWLNKDSRGGLWINGREKRDGEVIAPPPAVTDVPAAETGPSASATDTPAVAVETTGDAPVVPAVPTIQIERAPEFPFEPEVPSAAPAAPGPEASAANAPAPDSLLSAVRLLLKETRTGSFAGKVDRVAGELGKSAEDLVAALVGAGLQVPEKPREKPVFVEHAGEIFWFNQNAKGELWLNAKASKFADKATDGGEEAAGGEAGGEDGEKKPARRSRSRKKE